MNFTGDDGCQNYLVFGPMLSSLILDSNKKFTNCVLIRISSEIIKLFDTNLEPTINNLANGRVILKSNNSILDLYIAYKLKPRNCTNYSPIKFLLNKDSLQARLNNHYKAWSCNKKKHKRIKA